MTHQVGLEPASFSSYREDLLETVLLDGGSVTEVPVWNSGSLVVDAGALGLIRTVELNGCHASILSGQNAAGERTLDLTHYPPHLGSRRYQESVRAIADARSAQGVKIDTVVSVVDSQRYPSETSVLAEIFPDAPATVLSYDSRDPDRAYTPAYGEVVAILDYSDDAAQLYIGSEAGDMTIPLPR